MIRPPPQWRSSEDSLNRSKQNTDKDSDGLVALKSFTMHGFKDSNSSPNPSGQFSIKDRDEGLVADTARAIIIY